MEKRLPDLRLDEFRVTDYLEDELDMEIFVEPVVSSSAIICTHCGSSLTMEHGAEERFFRDLNIYDKRVGVEVQTHRFKCKDCNRTFSLQYKCIGPKEKMSQRLRETIQKKALHRTFTSVAEEYGLAAKSVENAFTVYADILDRRPDVIAPKVLGIDECHLQKVMRPVYVDIENATILEMGRSVKKDDVIRDVRNFSGLDKVEVVATDMCKAYKGAIQELIPNAIHVIDKFHVVQAFLRTVDEARYIIYETMKADIAKIADPIQREEEYNRLMDMKIDAFMFRKNPSNMNDYRLYKYKEICEAYRDFASLAWLRENFMKIYQCKTIEEAKSAFVFWKGLVPRGAGAYNKMWNFANGTMKTWGKEIFNYFNIEGEKKTNATTERLNGAIKSMQNMGRGYSYKVLRAKMLFGSQVAKKPLYERISRKQELQELDDGLPKNRFMNFSINEQFELPACESGVVEVAGYYDDVAPKKSECEEHWDDCMWREYHMHDAEIDLQPHSPEPKKPDRDIIQNGGASIELITRYYKSHGECI